ncbi:MAG: hypothetical protein QM571_06430 [Micrococcaceae bacterium]
MKRVTGEKATTLTKTTHHPNLWLLDSNVFSNFEFRSVITYLKENDVINPVIDKTVLGEYAAAVYSSTMKTNLKRFNSTRTDDMYFRYRYQQAVAEEEMIPLANNG